MAEMKKPGGLPPRDPQVKLRPSPDDSGQLDSMREVEVIANLLKAVGMDYNQPNRDWVETRRKTDPGMDAEIKRDTKTAAADPAHKKWIFNAGDGK